MYFCLPKYCDHMYTSKGATIDSIVEEGVGGFLKSIPWSYKNLLNLVEKFNFFYKILLLWKNGSHIFPEYNILFYFQTSIDLEQSKIIVSVAYQSRSF